MEKASGALKVQARHCVLLLCGLPGSGKSSLAARLAACLRGPAPHPLHTVTSPSFADSNGGKCRFEKAAVFDFDEAEATLRRASREKAAEADEEVPCFSPSLWKRSRDRVRALVKEALSSESPPCLIILDDNFYYRSMRREYARLARAFNSTFVTLFMDIPLALCLERNRARTAPQVVPEALLKEMSEKLEPPNSAVCSWEKMLMLFHEVPQSNDEIATVLAQIIQFFDEPIPNVNEIDRLHQDSRARDAQATHDSLVHQVDLLTRKVVSAILKGVSKDNTSKAAAEKTPAISFDDIRETTQALRKDFLENLRSSKDLLDDGEVDIDERAHALASQFEAEVLLAMSPKR